MRAARRAAPRLLLAACFVASQACAAAESEDQPPPPETPGWHGAVSAYLNLPRGDDAYVTGIATANRGAFHLEARTNYEGMDAYSLFIGYNFAAGNTVRFEVTPLLGVVTGSTHSVVGGFEATVTGPRADAYVELEYVPDASPSGYIYAWSEFALRPVDWFRVGLVAQRTRVYGNSRNLQRGAFAQAKGKYLSAAVYWFNPSSHDQVIVVAVAFSY
ncbi:hypothetical protein [Cupriavidus lacunae]|uniref:hypothetical protein n=1 Tax=Cupriavidus lacunae TaxID=2666307 RepID=UPI001ABFF12D|nr:hypothetical protein [Cupriavidus lacunae]